MTNFKERDFALDNLDLAFKQLEGVVGDAGIIAEITDGSNIILLPPNDPDVAMHNLRLMVEKLGIKEPNLTISWHFSRSG